MPKLKPENRKDSSEFDGIDENKEVCHTTHSTISVLPNKNERTPVYVKSITMRNSSPNPKLDLLLGDAPLAIENEEDKASESETIYSCETLELEAQLGLLEDDILDAFDFIKSINFDKKQCITGASANPHILCLDLDETLIYSVPLSWSSKYQASEYVPGICKNGRYVMLRPNAEHFVSYLSSLFTIYVFSYTDIYFG